MARQQGRNGLRYYHDQAGQIRWRATANGHTVADSGQGYNSKRDAARGARAAAIQLAKAALGITLR